MNKRSFSGSLVSGAIVVALSLAGAGCNESSKKEASSPVRAELADFSVSDDALSAYLEKSNATREDNRYKRLSLSYVERNALADAIMAQGDVSPDVMYEIKNARNNTIIKAYLDDFAARSVSDEDVLGYYNKHVDKYSSRKLRAAQILIATTGLSDGEKAKKYEYAMKIAEEARGGSDFSELAKKYSDDKATSEKGGMLGWLTAGGGENDVLYEVLSAMSVGGVSEPIQVGEGFLVLKFLEEDEVNKKAFDKVKDEIEYQLKLSARSKEVKRLKSIAASKVSKDMSGLGFE
jgi:hypothetical protein